MEKRARRRSKHYVDARERLHNKVDGMILDFEFNYIPIFNYIFLPFGT